VTNIAMKSLTMFRYYSEVPLRRPVDIETRMLLRPSSLGH